MSFRFQRRSTLFPGVRLNFSRRGISTSIGPRGASITLGSDGMYANVGIPNTGVSIRRKVTGSDRGISRREAPVLPSAASDHQELVPIASTSLPSVSSHGLGDLKELIIRALTERVKLQDSFGRALEDLERARTRLRRASHWLWGLFLGRTLPERAAVVESKKEELAALQQRLEGAVIDTDFGLDAATGAAFEALTQAFIQLSQCQVIWDVTGERFSDRRVTRSSAERSVDRRRVHFEISEDAILQSDTRVLQFRNANGADLSFYPGFMMMKGGSELALIEHGEIDLDFDWVRFTETESIPSDSTVVAHTWAKCNKDGSPDRRFSGNYQIPVAKYGQVKISSASGLREEYLISNAASASKFVAAYSDFKKALVRFASRGTEQDWTQLASSNADDESVARSIGAFELKSSRFLRNASASSGQQAADLLTRYHSMFEEDCDGFSGTRSMNEIEQFVRAVAAAPGIVKAFADRTPAASSATPGLVRGITAIAQNVIGQARAALEAAAPELDSDEPTRKALAAAREMEAKLRAASERIS